MTTLPPDRIFACTHSKYREKKIQPNSPPPARSHPQPWGRAFFSINVVKKKKKKKKEIQKSGLLLYRLQTAAGQFRAYAVHSPSLPQNVFFFLNFFFSTHGLHTFPCRLFSLFSVCAFLPFFYFQSVRSFSFLIICLSVFLSVCFFSLVHNCSVSIALLSEYRDVRRTSAHT